MASEIAKRTSVNDSVMAPRCEVKPGLQSNFATVYSNDKQKVEQPEPKFEGRDISKNLLNHYEENYMKKFSFEKGQFH